jgi:ATP citrate (pro-S)-lyase
MIQLSEIRMTDIRVVVLGSHPGIIQSILDYDFLIGKQQPSIIAIIASGRKQERYFWGETEVILPVVANLELLDPEFRKACTAVLNVQSARRVLVSSKQAIDLLPNVKLLTIFAEQTPEAHSLELYEYVTSRDILVAGPSSVGILLPGYMKLGAIGGTQHRQLSEAGILDAGNTAVISTSGGIVNELIHTVTGAGFWVSFAMAVGGDRYPITTPAQAMLLAEADKQTERIIYFGELGGADEYEIAELIDQGRITKEIIAYVAGTVAELFETPPQFGHAKAMAQNQDESASAKKARLSRSGVQVCETFGEIADKLEERRERAHRKKHTVKTIGEREQSMIVSHISGDIDQEVQLLGSPLLETVESHSTASLVLSMLLGSNVKSKKAEEFIDYVLRILVDHGPYVSGAMNTIVTARAGRDLVSSLAAGLLTVGPRFGGAINTAAECWLYGVNEGVSARQFIEGFSRNGGIIPGIGHKKYRLDLPDPRVSSIKQFSGNSNGDRYLQFALNIEAITTTKKATLILNVDGVIAAILLDILESELRYTREQLQELVDIEFFNALFVLSRSVGFTAHYLDQRRHDEGLFRLPDKALRYLGN